MLQEHRTVSYSAAKQVLEILEQGYYVAPSGARVSIAERQAAAEANAKLYLPEQLDALRAEANTSSRETLSANIELQAATTQQAALELSRNDDDIVLLNFASARNPGGGFLGGAKAQEEDICRCSGLYRTLLTQREYYEHHRANRSLLYSDRLIYSPGVPFFRVAPKADYLQRPFYASVITAPAPNAGALERNQKDGLARVRETFVRRWANVLCVAHENGHRTVLLGAWGCGAFRNDPELAANTAKEVLGWPGFAGAFERVVFAIPSAGKVSGANYVAFVKAFG
jgi:uncharacterized protein (TIGR02452 family)